MDRWVANILETSLGLQPGERLVVMFDEPLQHAGEALVAAARQRGAGEARAFLLPDTGVGFTVVSAAFVQAVKEADVLVSLRSELYLPAEDAHMRAAMSAFRQGGRGRWAMLAQLDDGVLERELSADFEPVAVEAERLASELGRGTSVHITSEAGTDLVLSYAGRPLQVETGLLRTPGALGNLPPGEVYVAPLESSAEGRLVVDLCIGDLWLDAPVTLHFERGRVVKVEGGLMAEFLPRRLGEDPWAWTIGEFGLGANPHIRPHGRVALDEKALGTAHIALGANRFFGGENLAQTHYDCVISAPRVEVR